MSDRPAFHRTALYLSVALNLLLIGAAVGGIASGVRLERTQTNQTVTEKRVHQAKTPPQIALPAPAPATGPSPAAESASMLRMGSLAALPAPMRAIVRRDLARSWSGTQALRAEALAARRRLRMLVASEPYDLDAVNRAAARMRAADAALQAAWQDAVLQSLARFPAEDRRAAIELMAREGPRAGGARPGATREPGPPPLRDRFEQRRRMRERFRGQ